MKQKVYVLVHTNDDKEISVNTYASMKDAQYAMRVEWENAIVRTKECSGCTDSEFEEYKRECAYIEETRAAIPNETDWEIDTYGDVWKIHESELPEAKKEIVGYQLVSDKGEIPSQYTSYQIFRNKEDAEKYRNDYNAEQYNVVPVYDGDIEDFNYISPITRHHKLKVGEEVCVLRYGMEYVGWGVVTKIDKGIITVKYKSIIGLVSDNIIGGAWCSPNEVFQIVPNKNCGGMIVCYEQELENGNMPYFTPCDLVGHRTTELTDGEPDLKKLV